MRVWFIRANGETAHNEPATPLFVPGEPPDPPTRRFNYRQECLKGGFARVGWPAAGSLAAPAWRHLASARYGELIRDRHFGYLERFRTIKAGDVVLLPADSGRYEVHAGVVVNPRNAHAEIPGSAYYYRYDIPAGEWFENAHRVDVEWCRAFGRPAVFNIPQIGGGWMRGFAELKGASTVAANIVARSL